MACWSAENATKAYLRTLTMGKGDKEPDVAEFISAVAAGNNAQVMVMGPSADPAAATMLLSLVAAAHQTGGRVISVSRDHQELDTRKHSLGPGYAQYVHFLIIGDVDSTSTLKNAADFVLIDCKCSGYDSFFMGHARAVVVGYNAMHVAAAGRRRTSSNSTSQGFKTHFLPIGGGLMVSRSSSSQGIISSKAAGGNCRDQKKKKSCWVVRVDQLTGEEHAYRIVSPRPPPNMIHA